MPCRAAALLYSHYHYHWEWSTIVQWQWAFEYLNEISGFYRCATVCEFLKNKNEDISTHTHKMTSIAVNLLWKLHICIGAVGNLSELQWTNNRSAFTHLHREMNFPHWIKEVEIRKKERQEKFEHLKKLR